MTSDYGLSPLHHEPVCPVCAEQIRELTDLVWIATQSIRDLVHSGWSSLMEKQALSHAEAIDRRAAGIIR